MAEQIPTYLMEADVNTGRFRHAIDHAVEDKLRQLGFYLPKRPSPGPVHLVQNDDDDDA